MTYKFNKKLNKYVEDVKSIYDEVVTCKKCKSSITYKAYNKYHKNKDCIELFKCIYEYNEDDIN